MRKLKLNVLLLGAILVVASCKSDESPVKPRMTVGDAKINLSGAHIYKYGEYDDDYVDDLSSENTHHIINLYITDGDLNTTCPTETYFFYIELTYPINESLEGNFEFNKNNDWIATDRRINIQCYYNLVNATDCDWPAPYKWWGSEENPAPDGIMKIKVSNNVMTLSMEEADWEDWTYSIGQNWTLDGTISVKLFTKATIEEL